ncbi:uridine kinase family protein [Arthrobacter cavernae]|uniref:AAA family ATPase n=1 Tax=Arthrobacter cavernae TaxID=2817681 RepID=A0A939HE30_9MICC|nr:AAA family ATPase [Arthrobacter cavernae]MBO1266673.1 AAA family ATPase [Arthrobacter cavernae]
MSMHEQTVAIAAILDRRDRTIVAVDGPSAAGKSTFARTLAGAAGQSTVLHLDDFYRPMPAAKRAALTPAEGAEQFFDVDRLITQALAPLRAGRAARFQAYDWATDRLGEWRDAPATRLVIVEGVHAADLRCRAFLDVTVFVATAPQVRWERMLARGQNDPEQIRRWLAAEDWYFTQQGVPEAADWVVPGDAA